MALLSTLFKKTKEFSPNTTKQPSFYNLDCTEGIYAIPNYQDILKYANNGSLADSILGVLQRKATEHSQNGNTELAIACLEKSFYIMLNSNYIWGDYAYRYIKYLKNDRQFDKARHVEKLLKNWDFKNRIPNYIVEAKKMNTDLVEANYPINCDSLTAKYRGRIFCISGKDKRFPLLSNEVALCSLQFRPFIYGITKPHHCNFGSEIAFSNRPFLDDRSEKEISIYNQKLLKRKSSADDEDDYYWIYEHIPELAPKSLSGYVRMKKSNSKNYQKIIETANEIGYKIK